MVPESIVNLDDADGGLGNAEYLGLTSELLLPMQFLETYSGC